MLNNNKVLGIILARSGSKGLRGKNIKIFNGKPLIEWTILDGLESKYIDDLIVSTDGTEIAQVALSVGAEVPFIRPPELATDISTSADSILHALDWLSSQGRDYEYLVLLEPTSPQRDADDIDRALEYMLIKNAPAVVSVCQAETIHPDFMYILDNKEKIVPFSGNYSNGIRRQDLPPVYFLDGTVYCSKVAEFRNKRGFYHENTHAIVLPKWKSFEIDDELDFVMIEALMKLISEGK
jgi:CMP-N,N'-diacetyllegionaminic acid synthase